MEEDSTVEACPQMFSSADSNEKLKEWFSMYPDVESTLYLPLDQKKEFILFYKPEELSAKMKLLKTLEEAEKVQASEIQKGNDKAPFSPELIEATFTIACFNIIEKLFLVVG